MVETGVEEITFKGRPAVWSLIDKEGFAIIDLPKNYAYEECETRDGRIQVKIKKVV